MGWSTNLYCDIEFYKETYNSRYEVESKIEDLKEDIKNYKQTLRDLALMTEPDIMIKSEEQPYYVIGRQVEDTLELLEEDTIELYKLNLLLSNWDSCHNEDGLAIDPPDEVIDKAYLNGDFVNSVKYPNSNHV